MKQIWWNGSLVPLESATVHVQSETALRAINAFEGLRAYWQTAGQAFAVVELEGHLDRLRETLRLIHLPAQHLVDPLRGAVHELVRAASPGQDLYLRPTIYLVDGSYTAAPERCSFGSFVSCREASSPSDAASCYVSTVPRVAAESFPAKAKSGASYAMFRLARLEARANGYEEAILLDSRGRVSETGGASVFVVTGAVVATPDLSQDILDSVTRRIALEILRTRLGLEVEERPVSRAELLAASEVFLTGTLDEVRPVLRLSGSDRELDQILAESVRDEYLGVCRGELTPLATARLTLVGSGGDT